MSFNHFDLRITAFGFALLLSATIITAQNTALPMVSAPLGVPKPGPTNEAPYSPQPILQGGVVVALYPPGRRT